MNKSESINELAKALVNVQKELTHAQKDTKGYNYNYSNLEECITSSRDLLTKNGLAITQLVGETSEQRLVSVTTILMHESGQYIQTTASVPLIKTGQNDAQGMGACITYLRRYAYQAIIGQASEDSDASGENQHRPAGSITPSNKPTEKQLALLRKNLTKLSKDEIEFLKNGDMSFDQASKIIDEIIKQVRQ